MPAVGLHHYNIRALREQLPAIRDFYIEILGLEEGFRPAFRTFGHWLYAGDQPVVHLTADESSPSAAESLCTIDHVAFACSDFDAMCRKLKSANVEYTLAEVPGEGIRQVLFLDPLGNGIELSFLTP